MSTIKPKLTRYDSGDMENKRTQDRIVRALQDFAAQLDSSVSLLLDLLGATRGSILFRGANGWTVLPPGVAGQHLTTNGAGADPTWS